MLYVRGQRLSRTKPQKYRIRKIEAEAIRTAGTRILVLSNAVLRYCNNLLPPQDLTWLFSVRYANSVLNSKTMRFKLNLQELKTAENLKIRSFKAKKKNINKASSLNNIYLISTCFFPYPTAYCAPNCEKQQAIPLQRCCNY